MSIIERITDLDTFLVYSIALEEEAAERHDELADMMGVHNNPEVASSSSVIEYTRKVSRSLILSAMLIVQTHFQNPPVSHWVSCPRAANWAGPAGK